jgi:hypothetical protein
VDYRSLTLWLKYAEMEMKNKFVNHARNVWDRAVSLLPRVDQLWYKYIHMEEMLGNVAGARQARGLSKLVCNHSSSLTLRFLLPTFQNQLQHTHRWRNATGGRASGAPYVVFQSWFYRSPSIRSVCPSTCPSFLASSLLGSAL